MILRAFEWVIETLSTLVTIVGVIGTLVLVAVLVVLGIQEVVVGKASAWWLLMYAYAAAWGGWIGSLIWRGLRSSGMPR